MSDLAQPRNGERHGYSKRGRCGDRDLRIISTESGLGLRIVNVISPGSYQADDTDPQCPSGVNALLGSDHMLLILVFAHVSLLCIAFATTFPASRAGTS